MSLIESTHNNKPYNNKPYRNRKNSSRRDFIKTGLVATKAVALGVGGITVLSKELVDRVEEKTKGEELKKEIAEKVLFLESKYRIVFLGTFADSNSSIKKAFKKFSEAIKIEYNEASLVKINRALDYLIDDFSKYPVFFIRNLNISFINIVDNLISRGKKGVVGLASNLKNSSSPKRNILNLEISSGVLNRDYNFSWSEEKIFHYTVHHELFHTVFNHIDPPSWRAFFNLKDKSSFITKDGTTDIFEDFSEIASAMMNNSYNIFDKINKNETLKKKVDFLKKVMFKETFGLIDTTYWEYIKKGEELPLDFFEKRKEYLLSLDFEQFKQDLKLNNCEDEKSFFVRDKSLTISITDEVEFKIFKTYLTKMEI